MSVDVWDRLNVNMLCVPLLVIEAEKRELRKRDDQETYNTNWSPTFSTDFWYTEITEEPDLWATNWIALQVYQYTLQYIKYTLDILHGVVHSNYINYYDLSAASHVLEREGGIDLIFILIYVNNVT